MDQHLCVVQTVDRNPFKTIGSTSRCPRTRQSRRGRSKCLVSFLVSLVVGRKGSSSHAPLLTDSFCWVWGESESDYHPAHRSTFPPDPPAPASPQQRPQSPELTGLINPLVTREELESLSLSLSLSPQQVAVSVVVILRFHPECSQCHPATASHIICLHFLHLSVSTSPGSLSVEVSLTSPL